MACLAHKVWKTRPPPTTSAVLKGTRKIANRSEKKDCEILFILLC